jgi:hypothetical protein
MKLTSLRALVFGTLLACDVAAPHQALAQGAPTAPTAQQKETARGLVLSGRKKREQDKMKEALADFSAAWKVIRNPTTGFELGRQQSELGLLVEARDTLLEVGRLPVETNESTAFTRARAEAKSLAESLVEVIPSLTLAVDGRSPGGLLEVTLDDQTLSSELLSAPLKVNPGIHRVIVKEGARQKSAEVLLARGETRELRLALDPVGAGQSQPVSAPHWLVWVGLGVAVGGGVAGGVTGGFAIAQANEVVRGCPDQRCPPALHDTLDSANALALGSTIAFAVGGAGLSAMIVGLFLPGEAPSTKETSAIRLDVTGSGLRLSGSFP